MADDVKVKFSGDFSDVPTGAQKAVATAGTAMKGWFNEFAQGTASGIIASLSLSSIFGKFKDNISDALHYFRELDLTIRRVGGSSADFQKLAGAGKQLGVSMESVGRAVNFFNKYVGQAAQGSKSHQQSLVALGFTTKEIEEGTISAIEVISRLGDEYDRTGNDTTVAAKAMELFGKQGSTLIPIIKAGREQLDEMTKGMKIYSEETIRAASETQKNVEKMEKSWAKFGRSIVEAYANYFQKVEASQFTAMTVEEELRQKGTSKEKATTISESIATASEGNTLFLKQAIKQLRSFAKDSFFEEDSQAALLAADRLQAKLDEILKPKEKKQLAPEEPAGSLAAMSASTLQQIGGGDVSSIMSGVTPMNEIADNTKESAVSLKTLVDRNPFVPQTDGSVAK